MATIAKLGLGFREEDLRDTISRKVRVEFVHTTSQPNLASSTSLASSSTSTMTDDFNPSVDHPQGATAVNATGTAGLDRDESQRRSERCAV